MFCIMYDIVQRKGKRNLNSVITLSLRIILKHVRSYGNDRYYPACPLSQMICELLNRKSLTFEQLEIIKSHGVSVEIND